MKCVFDIIYSIIMLLRALEAVACLGSRVDVKVLLVLRIYRQTIIYFVLGATRLHFIFIFFSKILFLYYNNR